MSLCGFDARRLEDYADGELAQLDGATVERHLAGCADCREALRELREWIAAARKLQGIEPQRDLFPEIVAAIEGRAGDAATGAVAPRSAPRWLAAAAALLLALVGGAAGWWWRGTPEAVRSVAAESTSAILSVEAPDGGALLEIIAATDALADLVEARRGQISPEMAAILEQNLAIIDRAIAELRQAGQPPDGSAQTLALSAMYRNKLELLRRAARLST